LNILICGDTGFIGSHIARALRGAGHQVSGLRAPRTDGRAPLDYTRATTADHWTPWLTGVDAVINAVGVLRDTRRRPMAQVHTQAPLALFEACAAAGVRRVIQVSALGVDALPQAYARSKLAAEQGLLVQQAAGRLDPVVLRPSVVCGRGGAGSEMFMRLARLPWLVMPGAALRARIQPVAVTDIADAVVALLGEQHGWCGVLPCAGPRALTLGELINLLRQQLGHADALQCGLPDWWSGATARVGDLLPFSPWSSDTLAMLRHDNIADAGAFAQVLGRSPCPPEQLLARAWA
jgi:nucleoside-diphosphate-sugar epimerase